eukprot:GHRQ01037391.1.p1 GENE.GHRQ01037391.1~~GHRQ01037391.1.p1  ORF type:complete len:108 (-),score=30.97 GHRQ01037391.1:107-430(-)
MVMCALCADNLPCPFYALTACPLRRYRSVFDMAEQQYGFPPLTLLDIGGGFTAPCDEPSSRLFRQTASTINTALDNYFPPGCGVDVISEPGRCACCAGASAGADRRA